MIFMKVGYCAFFSCVPSLSRSFGCQVLGLLIACGLFPGDGVGRYFFNLFDGGSADGRFGGCGL